MMRTCRRLLTLAAAIAAGSVVYAAEPTNTSRAYLLNVGRGQLPNDTGSDRMKITLVEKQPDLGDKAIQVEFLPDDSFGDRSAKIENWKPFTRLRFDAFNPTKETVGLTFNVNHRRTTSYQTRAVAPFSLKPGKNSIEIGIDDLANVNGSAPDLAKVLKWFIAIDQGPSPTIFFGDIYLEGAAAPEAPITAQGGAAPAVYTIRGKVGSQEVELTATPQAATNREPAAKAKVAGDPARLARIQAAKMPKVQHPVMFDTPEADAIVSALEIFPADNPWNLLVSDWPLHPASKQLIAAIGADKPLRANDDMGYVIVPANQPRVAVKLGEYSAESDAGPYPVPENTPIEGWPANYQRREGGKPSLDDVQRDRLKEGGDRHAIVVDPTNRMLYEFYSMRKTDQGWTAAGAAIFDLKTNKLRPDGWTSTDAAGLPLFPAVVRHDELKRGSIDHALRVTIPKSRKSYVYPATHHAGHGTDDNLPRMGERLRLRADFDISAFGPEARVILTALKRYGMFVADNGIAWALSVAPDPRIDQLHDELRRVKGSDFEVITAPPGYTPPSQ